MNIEKMISNIIADGRVVDDRIGNYLDDKWCDWIISQTFALGKARVTIDTRHYKSENQSDIYSLWIKNRKIGEIQR